MIEPHVRHWSSTALHLRGILVAKPISELALQGERDPTRLREGAVKGSMPRLANQDQAEGICFTPFGNVTAW